MQELNNILMVLHHPDLVQTPHDVSRLKAGGSYSGLWTTWGGAWAGTHWGSEFPPPALGELFDFGRSANFSRKCFVVGFG